MATMADSTRPRRLVVKLGTGVLTSGVGRIDEARVASICAQVAQARAAGSEVLVVSSGAVGLGMGRLGLARRPRETARKQACAAVGQSLLMQVWQRGFDPHGVTAAQVLLTHDDLRVRGRSLGVRATLEEIQRAGAVAVINENDTVSAAEIRFGDNDTLSAMVASLVGADLLVILSTAPGLIDMKGTGLVVPQVPRITTDIETMAGGTTSETAVGGMVSKISAAKLATRAGCAVVIASGAEEAVLTRLLGGEGIGTRFHARGAAPGARKRWLADLNRPAGTIAVNARAVPPLLEQGRSLLAVGVTGSTGRFPAGAVVDIAGPDGTKLARGRTAFGSDDIPRIAGRSSDELRVLYPERRRLEVVHRNDLALL
jgi:glutamate 5-kinase